MKAILYFFGGCLVIGLILSLIFSQLPVLPMAGRSLLVLLQQNQYEQAYQAFSKDFQKRYPLPVFTANIRESGLSNYQEVNWSKDVMDPQQKRGVLVGTVVTKQNTPLYVEMDFVEETPSNGGAARWVIQDIRIKHSP